MCLVDMTREEVAVEGKRRSVNSLVWSDEKREDKKLL